MKKKFLTGLTALCVAVTSISVPFNMVRTVQATEETTVSEFGDFRYIILEDGTVEISKYTGSEEKVTIPEEIDGKKVTSIGDRAFRKNRSLKEITLPEGLISIGDCAFESCYNLKEITLPKTIENIGGFALGYADSEGDGFCTYGAFKIFGYEGTAAQLYALRERFTFESLGGTSFTYEDFIYFEMENGEIEIVSYLGSEESIIVPGKINEKIVTSIGKSAFYECTSLKEIILPDGLTSIGGSTFAGCLSLSKISLPNGLTSIGDVAFASCKSLKEITLPDSLTNIGEWAFTYCEGLSEIDLPDGLTYIGYSTFYKCTSLSEIDLPDGLINIGDSAFYECTSLSKIDLPDGLTDIESSAFLGCGLTEIYLPKTVENIWGYALGYQYNDEYELEKIEGFKIFGYAGTAAETYAKEHEFAFEVLEDKPEGETSTEGTTSKPEEETGTEGTTSKPEEETGTEGTTSKPEGETSEVATSKPEKETSTEASTEAVTNKEVYKSEVTLMDKSVFAEVLNQNKTQDVEILSNDRITFRFAKGSMKEVANMESYDFGSKVVTEYASLSKDVKESVDEKQLVCMVSYNYSGTLPGKAEISIYAGKEYAGKTLYYYLCKEDKTLELVQEAKVDEAGMITVTQDHCSDYVVLNSKVAATPAKTGDAVVVLPVVLLAFASAVVWMSAKKRAL